MYNSFVISSLRWEFFFFSFLFLLESIGVRVFEYGGTFVKKQEVAIWIFITGHKSHGMHEDAASI